MNPTEFTLRLMLLFLPGIITKLLLDSLTANQDKRNLH